MNKIVILSTALILSAAPAIASNIYGDGSPQNNSIPHSRVTVQNSGTTARFTTNQRGYGDYSVENSYISGPHTLKAGKGSTYPLYDAAHDGDGSPENQAN